MAPCTNRVTGLVLAAGGSKRLGQPKQLLPYRSGPLLAHVLDTARECEFDQLLCVLGGGYEQIREHVGLDGVEVVENHHYGDGCSSSIAAALAACAYADGRGHPLAFARSTFGDLAALHGDRGVWKLLDRAGDDVVDVPVTGPVPLDVWESFRAVLAADA